MIADRLRGLRSVITGPKFVLRLAGLGTGILLLMAWFHEHDARVRQAAELQQLRKQTASDVADLQARAEAAIREVNQQRAEVIRNLESRQQKLGQEADQLRNRLGFLRSEEKKQVEQVATLPTSEVVTRVATRLGLPSHQTGPGLPQTAVVPEEAGTGAGARPAPKDRTNPAAAPLELSDAALRKIEQALVELDSCREQSVVKDQEVANCRNQVATLAAVVDQQAASLKKLNEALADKDQILAHREAEFRTELKAARGTWPSHLVRTLEHVAIGVAIGLVVR